MCALSSAVRPSAAGVPRRAAAAPSDASERAPGMKRPRGGDKSSQELLQKSLASELDALRGLLKKAELISRRGASKGGAPAAGKKEQFLASKQRPKPMEDGGGNAPSVKRTKISTPVEQQKFADESKDDKLGEESKGEVVLEQERRGDSDQIMGTPAQQSSEPASGTAQADSTSQAESVSGDSTCGSFYISTNKPVYVRPLIDMPGLIHRANLRRQQLEMERAAQPDHPRDLQRLGISV